MKCFKSLSASLLALISGLFFAGCETEESPFTGLRLSGANCYVAAGKTAELTAVFVKEDKENKSAEITWTLINDTTGGASLTAVSLLSGQNVNLSNDQSVSLLSGQSATFTAGSTEGGLCGIKVSYENYSVTAYIGVEENGFSLENRVPGFAGLGADISKMTKSVTVSDPDDLISYASQGGYIIYIESEIDMSRGMLPAAGSKFTTSTTALDEFVAANTSYSTYAAWLKGETNVSSSEDTKTSTISKAYKSKIQICPASNTAIIGVGSDAIVRGGTFSISTNNVIIRNLTIRDAVDPFPHHESGDGWNAQHDNIGIDGGSNIWIDHCTLEDTLKLGTAANGEKWQVYDGLCDIKSSAFNITVSNCIFRNHDKTMLIGSGDSDGSNKTRTVSLFNNLFENCGQRCPMVRNTKIHILNNVYSVTSGGFYSNSYCIGNRKNALIVAEANYFSAGTAVSNSDGIVTSLNNSGLADSGSLTETFNPYDYYGYIALSAKDIYTEIASTAGAGILSVSK